MIFANVFLSLAIILNTLNIVNFNEKLNKNQLSVEKNDVLTLKFDEGFFKFDEIAPKYFLNSQVNEIRCKGFMGKNFEKNFDEFYENLNSKIDFLNLELEKFENNSQAFVGEYVFQRKNHIITEIESLKDYMESMDNKQKRKIIYYEYINNEINKYNGFLGFSIILNDKENPILVGTIVMPEYIGNLESLITYKSINLYRNKYKNNNDIHTKPLSYFDKYFLNAVGFK